MIFRRKRSSAAAPPGQIPPPVTPAHAQENEGAQKSAGSAKQILLVDDDPVILGALSLKLKSKGYQVVTASDGSEALSAMRDETPDLMLMDVHFPAALGGAAWNGFSLIQWIRHMGGGKDLPVIVISGSDGPGYKDHAAAVGALALLVKPIDSDVLLASIDKALGQKTGNEPAAPRAAQPESFKTEPLIRTDLPGQSPRLQKNANSSLALGEL